MKRIALACAVLFCGYVAFSQNNLRGKVFDKTNNTALAGATVSIQGKTGIPTGLDGTFVTECKKGDRITVSFIGYESYSTEIRNCGEVLQIGLTPSGQYLDNVEISVTTAENKSLLYQPVSIAKLSKTELTRGTGLFLDDAINGNVPGVSMNRRTVSGGQQFNIRGYGNGSRGTRGISSNFDGQGYKVYLNGIPVTDAEGITAMDDIDFGSVSQVEIVKGPAGTLYGLAIAGAVNLKTKRPEKGETIIGQDLMLGNYGLQRYTTHVGLGSERSSVLVNYGRQKSDGFSVHNASHKDFVNISGEFQPNDKQTIMTYAGFSDSYDERLGELTLTQWANKDYSGNIDYIKQNAHSHVTSFRGGFGHTYSFSNNISATTTLFGTGFRSDVSSAGGWTDRTAVNYGLRSSLDTRFTLSDDISLGGITGIETQRQNAHTIGYNMKISPFDSQTSPSNPWVIGRPYYIINSATSNNATITGSTTVFTEWTLGLPHELSFTAGAGISNQKIVLDDRQNPATAVRPSHYDTSYKGLVSPHFAVNKVFRKNVSVYASFSKGYKAPVSSYFFITTPNGTPPVTSRVNGVLKPESGSQFEIGTKGNIMNNRLQYQLALFHTVFSDKMTTVAVLYNSTTTAYSYMVNAGKQDHKGVEALVKYMVVRSDQGFFRTIIPFLNLAWSDFTYGNNFRYQSVGKTTVTPVKDSIITVDYSGKQVAGVPRWTFNWGFDLTTRPGVYLNFIYNYRDGMPITSDGTNRTGSYNLLNAKLGMERTLGGRFGLDAFFGVNNITGTRYPIMVFVNQLPDAYIPAPPKAVIFGGVSLKYSIGKSKLK